MYDNLLFSLEEKRAILSLIMDMVTVDRKIHDDEIWMLQQVCKKFQLDPHDYSIAERLTPTQVAPIVKGMSLEKRKLTGYLLAATAAVDGDFADAEDSLYTMLASQCNLETGFTIREAFKVADDFFK